MQFNWYDIAGNIGVILIILSYFLLQNGRIEGRSLVYTLSNALGALLIMISLAFDFNLSAFIIELFWFGISVYGLIKSIKSGTESAL